jgi:hypothetical protein
MGKKKPEPKGKEKPTPIQIASLVVEALTAIAAIIAAIKWW